MLNALLPFNDFLWILQKEEYSSARYAFWLKRFFLRRNFVVSEKLARTRHLRLVGALARVLWLAALLASVLLFHSLWSVVALVLILLFTIPLFVLAANLILTPFFALAHERVRAHARAKVAAHAPMKVIAVVGSFGKTTTKHFLYEFVRFHYKAQMIPGSINTPSGIAAWICAELKPHTNLLIVEMDAYHAGEIAQSAGIVSPAMAIVTNVGDQHLERFGSRAALAKALAEVAHEQKEVVIADAATVDAIRPYVRETHFVEVDTTLLSYKGAAIAVPHLSSSNQENLARVLRTVELLDVPEDFVVHTCAALVLPDRRQKQGLLYGYEAVDDSYNISLTTARAGLAAARALADSKGKKLLVVAAGIPELGPEEKEGNVLLGKVIAATADHAIVLGTMFAAEIEEGLGSEYPQTRYARLSDFLAASHELFAPSEWILLLEPSLPDLYY